MKNMKKTKQQVDDSAEALDTREKKISKSNSKSTDHGDSTTATVYDRKKKRVADDSVVAVPAQNLEEESHDAFDTRGKEISNESHSKSTDDSAITRAADEDDAVDVVLPLKKRKFRADGENTQKMKRVADEDDAVLPLKKRQFRADGENTQKMKQVADEDDAVLPLKKRLYKADEENTQKMKQVADDSVDQALDTRVDADRKKKRVADEDDHAVPQKKKRVRSSSANVNVSSAVAAVALPRPKFHQRVLEANGNKPPTFLFKRRVGVTSQGNDIFLASYAQIENELSRKETRKLRLHLDVDSPVGVVATDQKGVDYEFRLSWDGVSVVPAEWVRLRAENGLKERDRVEGYAYWVGGQFRLALSIS